MSERFLDGRSAWVTGGVTGMGRAIALALADAGANVAVGSLLAGGELPSATYAALPTANALDDITDAIGARGVGSFGSGLDLRVDRDVNRFHRAAVDALGPIDILVNAAGISAQEEMIGHSDESSKSACLSRRSSVSATCAVTSSACATPSCRSPCRRSIGHSGERFPPKTLKRR